MVNEWIYGQTNIMKFENLTLGSEIRHSIELHRTLICIIYIM